MGRDWGRGFLIFTILFLMKHLLNNILNIIDFVFYKSYKSEEKKWASVPKFHAVIQVSLIFIPINLNLIILTEIILNVQIIGGKSMQSIIIVDLLIAIIVSFLVYLFYIRNKRYLKVLKKYNNINKEAFKKNSLKAILFIIFLIVSAIILTIISAQINY